jgi:hypothetical protein
MDCRSVTTLTFIKEDEMFKPRSRKRQKTLSSSPWRNVKNLFLAKSGALKDTSFEEPEQSGTDLLICPHDTTSGLGVKRGAKRKSSGKSPVNIF